MMQLSNKHWLIIFGILGTVIIALLAIIAWKTLAPATDKQAGRADVTPAISRDAPVDLVISYYQAIEAGNADRVKAAWADPASRQARYAVQAMLDFPDTRCRSVKLVKTSPESATAASVSADLECKQASSVKTYPVVFQLGSQAGQWKIIKLHMPDAPQSR
ncbi:MAG: hypothetical protein KJ914_14430 [Gammaproteobacteria bacterium]|nr:hypothetical protein [Gammaproteobacteria bacterium]MBU1724985.1 hypothetical protein [Gammaproteobacteria bacterium]MBU2007095.1 hypothetical protein [Gammaproteobacteria bacterium]